jgi:rhodanese-related sulfurtransferase
MYLKLLQYLLSMHRVTSLTFRLVPRHFHPRTRTTSFPRPSLHFRHSSLSSGLMNWRPYTTEKKWSHVSAAEVVPLYEKVTGFKLVDDEREEEEQHSGGHEDTHASSASDQHKKMTNVPEPSPSDHANQKPVFIDLRSPEEVKSVWIEGFLSIPFKKLKQHINESKLSKTAHIYLLDVSGYKSEKAADILVDAGFQHVHVIEGGLLRWIIAKGYLKANPTQEYGDKIEEAHAMMRVREHNVNAFRAALEKLGINPPPIPSPDISQREKQII